MLFEVGIACSSLVAGFMLSGSDIGGKVVYELGSGLNDFDWTFGSFSFGCPLYTMIVMCHMCHR